MSRVDEMTQASKTDFKYQWLIATVTCLCLVNIGALVGLPAVLIPALQQEKDEQLNIDLDQGSLLVFYFFLLGMPGSFIGGACADLFGRRPILLFCMVPFLVHWTMLALTPSFQVICLARAISGLGDGCIIALSPVYLSEMSHASLRGTFVNFVNIGQNSGFLLVYLLAYFFHWRMVGWIMLAFNIVLATLMFAWTPETPFFHILMNKEQEGRHVLQKLRGKDYDVTEELDEMVKRKNMLNANTHKSLKNKVSGIVSTIASRRFLKPFGILLLVTFMVFATGFYTMTLYIVTIFQESGADIDPYLSSIVVAGTKVLMSCFASLALKVFPHRKLFSSAMFLLFLCMILLAASSYTNKYIISGNRGTSQSDMNNITSSESDSSNHSLPLSDDNSGMNDGSHNPLLNYLPEWFPTLISWIPLVCITLMYAFTALGIDAVLRVMSGELFPTNIRSLAGSLAYLFASVVISLSSLLFPFILKSLEFHGTFLIQALTTLLGTFICWFIMPESKGKTLVSVEQSFDKNHARVQKHQSTI